MGRGEVGTLRLRCSAFASALGGSRPVQGMQVVGG
jgi:hypothetical protein